MWKRGEGEGIIKKSLCTVPIRGTEDTGGTWPRPATEYYTMFKGCTRALLGGLSGTTGCTESFPKINPGWSIPNTWVNLFKSCVWRCRTCIHACSKHVTQVGDWVILFKYALIKISPFVTYNIHLSHLLFSMLKKTHYKLQWLCIYFCDWCGHEQLE